MVVAGKEGSHDLLLSQKNRTKLALTITVAILFEIMRMPEADAQSVSKARSFDLFSRFCLKSFPDAVQISDALKKANWKRETGDEVLACKENTFCTSGWYLIEEPSKARIGLDLKSIFGRSQCSLTFSGEGLPLQEIAMNYNWKEDTDAGQRLSNKAKSTRVFRAQLDGKPLNFVFEQSLETPSYFDMTVTQIRVLPSDPN